MNEHLATLINAIIIAAIPVLVSSIVYAIKAAVKAIKSKTDSNHLKDILTDVEKLVVDAVRAVNQTYVDTLKKQDKFTEELHAEAFQRAYDTAVGLMNNEAKELIEKTFGNLQDYVTTLIEARVNAEKKPEA